MNWYRATGIALCVESALIVILLVTAIVDNATTSPVVPQVGIALAVVFIVWTIVLAVCAMGAAVTGGARRHRRAVKAVKAAEVEEEWRRGEERR